MISVEYDVLQRHPIPHELNFHFKKIHELFLISHRLRSSQSKIVYQGEARNTSLSLDKMGVKLNQPGYSFA